MNVHKNVTLLERRFMTVRLSRVRDGLKARDPANLGAPASPDPARIRAPNRWREGYFAKAHATRHIARDTSLGRARARVPARSAQRASRARASDLFRVSVVRARTRVVSSPRPRPTDRRCSFLRRPRARRSPRRARYVRASASTARLASADVLPPARSSRARALNRASSRTTLTPAAARTRCPSPPPPTPCARSVVARSPAVPSTAPSTTTATSSLLAR